MAASLTLDVARLSAQHGCRVRVVSARGLPANVDQAARAVDPLWPALLAERGARFILVERGTRWVCIPTFRELLADPTFTPELDEEVERAIRWMDTAA